MQWTTLLLISLSSFLKFLSFSLYKYVYIEVYLIYSIIVVSDVQVIRYFWTILKVFIELLTGSLFF